MGGLYRQIANGTGVQWEGVPVQAYGPENSTALHATRQVLIGSAEGARQVHLRYFWVGPGGRTSLDQHAHEHGVYVLHGHARVLLGDDEEVLGPGDVLYIPGEQIHQF